MSRLEYMTANDGLPTFKCVGCNKIYKKKFDEDLPRKFQNTYKFCVMHKFCANFEFCLKLQKGVYCKKNNKTYKHFWKVIRS